MTAQDIMEAIGHLGPVELDRVARSVRRLRAMQPETEQQRREAQLLKIIRQRRPPQLGRHYHELLRKLEAETLSSEERQKLMPLIEMSEAFAARRVKSLVELAQIRNVSLPELMQELGIKPQRV
jgi:hypothetical protein